MDALMTNGPFVTVDVEGAGMGQMATAQDGRVRVKGEVRTAPWVRPDTLTIYVGGTKVRTLVIPREERLFTYSEDLDAGLDTFVVVEVSGGANMFPVVPTFDEPPQLINDALAAIGGSLGLGGNAYGTLRPELIHPVTPMALTNPVYVDANGDGKWTPPGIGMLTYGSAQPVNVTPRTQATTTKATPPHLLWQEFREPVRGIPLDIRRIFQAWDHRGHH
jgi:hypothetical protein